MLRCPPAPCTQAPPERRAPYARACGLPAFAPGPAACSATSAALLRPVPGRCNAAPAVGALRHGGSLLLAVCGRRAAPSRRSTQPTAAARGGAPAGRDAGNGVYLLLLLNVALFVADHIVHLPLVKARPAPSFRALPTLCVVMEKIGAGGERKKKEGGNIINKRPDKGAAPPLAPPPAAATVTAS